MTKDRFYDNTRVSAYKRCPRYFYYRHIKDWAREGTSPPLVFGSSWHEAMDVVWELLSQNKHDHEDVAKAAWLKFNDKWTEEGMTPWEEMDDEEQRRLGARTPMVALEMLYEYIDQRQKILCSEDFELISIEQPFAVPLDPTDESLFYVGRLDKVFRWRGKVLGGEHKTTSSYKRGEPPFRSSFLDSFSPNSQVDGYIHALHMLYGEDAKGIWVDAALVHKTEHSGFAWVPVERQFSQLDSWLNETLTWIEKLENDKTLLQEGSGDKSYLPSFPKNTNNCMDYAGCPYLELCKMWPNPENKDTPLGYKEEHWSPFEKLELAKLGYEEEEDA